MRTQKLVYRRQSLKLSRLRLVPIFLKDSRGSKTEHAWKLPHARKARRGGEREKWFELKNEMKNHFCLSPPHLAFLAWADFHTHLPFAPSTIPEGKWGLLVVQSVVRLKKRLKRSGIWQMSFVTQLSKMINVKSWNNIVPSPGGSSDKILYFLFSPVSFLDSTDPVMSKFVPVIPTVVINIFPVELRIRELQTAPPGITSVSTQSLKSKLARIVQHYCAKVS